jgi:hypothetical protein
MTSCIVVGGVDVPGRLHWDLLAEDFFLLCPAVTVGELRPCRRLLLSCSLSLEMIADRSLEGERFRCHRLGQNR